MRTFTRIPGAPRQTTTLPSARFRRRSFGDRPDIHAMPRVAQTTVNDPGQPWPHVTAANQHVPPATDPVTRVDHDFRRIRVYAEATPAIHPHLTTNAVGMRAERAVASRDDPALSRSGSPFQHVCASDKAGPSAFQPTEVRRQELPGSAGTAPAEDQAIQGEACPWREPIDKGVTSAKEQVDRALTVLSPLVEGQPASPTVAALLQAHFHTTDRERVKQIAITYAAIRVALEAAVPYLCVSSTHDACSTEHGHVLAATRCAPDAEIAFCGQYFFVAGDVGRAQTLIHEFAHHVPALCQDHAYTHQAAYPTLAPTLAIKNPDSYATFATVLP